MSSAADDGLTGNERRMLAAAALVGHEHPAGILNAEAAGVRAATLNKLLFDDDQASIMLGVSTELLKVWRREGRGPQWVRLGKLVRYRLGDLRAYVDGLQTAQAA